jgi:hypothetical protein
MNSTLEDKLRAACLAYLQKEADPNVRTSYYDRKYIEEHFPGILSACNTLLNSRVTRVSLMLVGEQPMPRVQLKHGKRRFTVDPYNLLSSGLGTLLRVGWTVSMTLADALGPVLKTELAPLQADVTNAVSKALVDEEITKSIKDKLAKKREVAKISALLQVKELFRNVQGLVSKDDIVQAWDEVMVSDVMDS